MLLRVVEHVTGYQHRMSEHCTLPILLDHPRVRHRLHAAAGLHADDARGLRMNTDHARHKKLGLRFIAE